MSTLNGLDVSHYQAGLDLDRTGLDFAIIKATEGASYVDAECDQFVTQAKSAGMLWGVYAFWRAGVSVTAQADHFIDTVAGYIGHGLLVLDWESTDTGNVAGAKAWLDRVESKTGVRPIIYMSQSVAASHDWSSVSKNTALWVARYNSTIGSTGGWPVTMWQYTSSGHVAGWSGKVDLDHFYGTKAAWTALATGGAQPDDDDTGDDDMPSWKNTSYGVDHALTADGEWRVLTIGKGDEGGILYSFLTGPVKVAGELNVTLTGLPKGTEVDLRPTLVETKSGQDTRIVNEFPPTEFFAESGTTNITIPFHQNVTKGDDGWARRLRFHIRAWGGSEDVKITYTRVRGLYWEG